MVRLPVPGSDSGTWGNVLNEFLGVEHNSDGSLKTTGSLANKVDVSGGGKEKSASSTATSANTTISLANGNVQQLTLNISTTIALTGATTGTACSMSLYIAQNGTGGCTVAWPGSVKWPSAIPPTLSSGANKIDLVILETLDGGTTWYGTLAGADFR